MKHQCERCGHIAAAEQFGDGCPCCEAEIPQVFWMPEKKKEKKEKIMKKKIEPNISLVIDRAAEINAKIKELEKEIEPLKKEIEKFVKDNYTEKEILAGVTISGWDGIDRITGAEKREDAKPDVVFEYLDSKGLSDRFFDIVKVQIKDMDALIGYEKSKEFRPVVGIQMRQSLSLK